MLFHVVSLSVFDVAFGFETKLCSSLESLEMLSDMFLVGSCPDVQRMWHG